MDQNHVPYQLGDTPKLPHSSIFGLYLVGVWRLICACCEWLLEIKDIAKERFALFWLLLLSDLAVVATPSLVVVVVISAMAASWFPIAVASTTLNELIEFASVEPYAAALGAVVYLDAGSFANE